MIDCIILQKVGFEDKRHLKLTDLMGKTKKIPFGIKKLLDSYTYHYVLATITSLSKNTSGSASLENQMELLLPICLLR
jgi:hypothetical protein